MANTNSTQIANMEADPRVLVASDERGRVYAAQFDVAVAGTESASDTFALCRIPEGARVIEIVVAHSGLDGSTAATLDFGITDADGSAANEDTDFYTVTSGPLDVGTADGVSNPITDPADLNKAVPVESNVLALIAAETSLAAGQLTGHVKYQF